MSWVPFVMAYAALTLVLGTILHLTGILRINSLPIARAVVVISALLLLGELIAEERGLWVIPMHSGFLLMRTPIESILLIVTTVVNSLQLYVLVGFLMSRRGITQ